MDAGGGCSGGLDRLSVPIFAGDLSALSLGMTGLLEHPDRGARVPDVSH